MRQIRQLRQLILVRQVRLVRQAYYGNRLMKNWMNEGELSVHDEREIHWKPRPNENKV